MCLAFAGHSPAARADSKGDLADERAVAAGRWCTAGGQTGGGPNGFGSAGGVPPTGVMARNARSASPTPRAGARSRAGRDPHWRHRAERPIRQWRTLLHDRDALQMQELPVCPRCQRDVWACERIVIVLGTDGPVRVVTDCPHDPSDWTYGNWGHVALPLGEIEHHLALIAPTGPSPADRSTMRWPGSVTPQPEPPRLL
jgi:hypothetical protein